MERRLEEVDTRRYFTTKIDLVRLGEKLVASNKLFISVEEVVDKYCISPPSAGRLLSALTRLGYLEKWSRKVYIVNRRKTTSLKH